MVTEAKSISCLQKRHTEVLNCDGPGNIDISDSSECSECSDSSECRESSESSE